MQPQWYIFALAMVLCILRTAFGCSCAESFEQMIGNAEFAALVKVTSDEIPSSNGHYYEVDKICVLKTPYGTDVERVYLTSRRMPEGVRTSCDGPNLTKEKVYLIIGRLHDTDNPDVDSISYYGCGGFAIQWHPQMSPRTKANMKELLPFEDCPSEHS
ncbi:uncharacterized protein LOC123536482 [Mercenaria mercenaria]|uniref:uncharacterized protein LOC123536482 n=1 Tax=Mercenaria mercenaria TaxID=6596 RepID=UPI001E1D5686|nr:uncharacterized protein LOC123536482 [Mercenaria mercenaria]